MHTSLSTGATDVFDAVVFKQNLLIDAKRNNCLVRNIPEKIKSKIFL